MAGIKSRTPLTNRELLDLAPLELDNYREDRFRGDSNRANLAEFGEADRQILISIYQALESVFEVMLPGHHDGVHIARVLVELAPQRELILSDTARLGISTLDVNQRRHLKQIVHDIRGGALQSLLFQWKLFDLIPEPSQSLSAIFFLVRDHLKIMRNCVADLDARRFADDSARNRHGTDLLLEKWTSADFYGSSIPAQIAFYCTYTGGLCESCLEFSTLDRIIYNLLNNAARHADDHVVQFHILPMPNQDAVQNLRFVIANHVSGEHSEKLRAAVPDLGKLFRSGFTTGGHGVGMSIVGDFCSQAFGIYDDEAAQTKGYYGARWINDHFVTWFHWPVSGA